MNFFEKKLQKKNVQKKNCTLFEQKKTCFLENFENVKKNVFFSKFLSLFIYKNSLWNHLKKNIFNFF